MREIKIERVIFERTLEDLKKFRRTAIFESDTETIPDNAGTKQVSLEALNEIRTQKVLTCADVVVTSKRPDGTPVALSSFRSNPNGGNPGFWWVQGGMLSAGQSISSLLNERLKKEGGLQADSLVLAGIYRTVSERGTFCDTIQPCYFTHVSWEEAQKATTDKDHSSARFFSQKEFDALPPEQVNWYPRRLFSLALKTVPE